MTAIFGLIYDKMAQIQMRNAGSTGALKALKDKMAQLRTDLDESREMYEAAEKARARECEERQKV